MSESTLQNTSIYICMLSILKSLKILIFGNEGSSIFQHVCRLEYDEEENKELKDYQ